MKQTSVFQDYTNLKYASIPARIFLFVGMFLLLSIFSTPVFSQDEPEYDEISVFLNVPRVGGIELPAVIVEETVFLPVSDFFSFLKIRNIASAEFDSITGFFLNQESSYVIDKQNNRITFQDKVYTLAPEDMIQTLDNLYLKSIYFGKIFGLECSFNFRSLGVNLHTKIELPVIREMRQEQMRTNISRLKGEVKADTTIGRTFPAFHFGMADYSLVSMQQLNGRVDTRLNLALGAVVAGGEANVSLFFNNNQPFEEKQQQYLWRFVNNDFRAVRQVMVGKIATQATSSLYSPVVGVQLTNAPTTFRRSFGSYTLTDRTEPGWTVELYVNNVLVDYLTADASGFFKFEVPLVYGNSAVMLKFYGPWGEERSKVQNIAVPFNFLPAGEMQYTASAGFVEDSVFSRFSRGNINYGLASRITVGAGAEYLSSVTSGPMMPFVSTSIRLMSSLLLSGEYTYGVRSKAILTYRLPSNAQFELYYTQYEKGQRAINYNYLQERKAVISVPFRARSFSAYSRLTLNQIILPESEYTTSEFLLSGSMKGVGTNFTTYALFADQAKPYVYSNLSFSFRLPKSFVLIPQMQYEYNNQELISVKCGLEKQVSRNGFLSASYEKNFKSNIHNLELTFRYDFSFTQLAFTARQSNNNTTFTQSARGSLIYDRKSEYLHAGNRSSVGKGGIAIMPFLDMNCNDIQDADEPMAYGLNIHITGGRIEHDLKDTVIRILDLEPYTSYFLEFDKNSFDNIAWQLKNRTMRITVDPNNFKLIKLPVYVYGEASGMVYFNASGSERGQGRVIVCFYNEKGKLAGRTLSESDGYFSFLGLPPGKYTAAIDTAQLRRINMVASPATIPFDIEHSFDGDIRDDFEFRLTSLGPEKEAAKVPARQPVPVISREVAVKAEIPVTGNVPAPVAPKIVLPVLTKPDNANDGDKSGNIQSYAGNYAIQVGAFKVLENAVKVRAHLILALGTNVYILEQGGMYKVIITGFDEYAKAKAYLPEIRNREYKDAFIIGLKEASGMVYFADTDTQNGLGEILVALYNEAGALVDRTRSNAEGYFSFKGLPTGSYVAKVDPDQLKLINMVSSPETLPFEFERNLFTVAKTNLEFTLRTLVPDKPAQEPAKAASQIEKVTPSKTRNDDGIVKAVPTIGLPPQQDNGEKITGVKKSNPLPGTYAIQAGAYVDIENARKIRSRLIDGLNRDIFITEEDGMFKVVVIGFDDYAKAEAFLPIIRNRGFVEAFIVRIK